MLLQLAMLLLRRGGDNFVAFPTGRVFPRLFIVL